MGKTKLIQERAGNIFPTRENQYLDFSRSQDVQGAFEEQNIRRMYDINENSHLLHQGHQCLGTFLSRSIFCAKVVSLGVMY